MQRTASVLQRGVGALASTGLALTLAGTLALGSAACALTAPQPAFAETTETDAEPDEFQQQVEQTAAAYDEASARVDELAQQISDNEEKIAQLERDLPEQQERGAEALRELYKMQDSTPGLVSLVLSSENLTDFLTSFAYVDHIYDYNTSELRKLQAMREELDATRTSLAEAKKAAEGEEAAAKDALSAAQAAREEAQRKAQEEARRQAEEEARKAAEAAAAEEQRKQEEAAKEAEQKKQAEAEADAKEKAKADSGSTASESSANDAEPVSPPASDNADWSADKKAFVAEWSGRIDAYLAGSPMAGQGKAFAEAAWNYGVDPRWSPAIANTESSKGAACAYSHNAWGWGSKSWGSWEEAIDAHVRGLANGYGYTISVEAAKKYCPPNWKHWYNATSAQMNLI